MGKMVGRLITLPRALVNPTFAMAVEQIDRHILDLNKGSSCEIRLSITYIQLLFPSIYTHVLIQKEKIP
jgi:hypothetical protein